MIPVLPRSRRARRDVMRDDRADEQWMRAYAADDQRALAALFDRYAHRFLGMYRHCLQDEAAAEALLEATFAEMHRLRHSYRPTSTVRPWLFALAARLCLEALRRRSHPSSARSMPAASGDGFAGEDAVRAAVISLDGSGRLVLYLHRYEGMSFGEIAEVLGTNAQAVRTQAVETYSSLHERLRPFVERGETP